jgi:hypothetical protein
MQATCKHGGAWKGQFYTAEMPDFGLVMPGSRGIVLELKFRHLRKHAT